MHRPLCSAKIPSAQLSSADGGGTIPDDHRRIAGCLSEDAFRLCRDKPRRHNAAMVPLHVQLENSTLRGVIKRLRFPLELMLVCVRWYAAYQLSLRNLEEMMAERGVLVDHATVHRWSLKMLPVLAKVFRRRKHSVGRSWRVNETYVLVGGQRKM